MVYMFIGFITNGFTKSLFVICCELLQPTGSSIIWFVDDYLLGLYLLTGCKPRPPTCLFFLLLGSIWGLLGKLKIANITHNHLQQTYTIDFFIFWEGNLCPQIILCNINEHSSIQIIFSLDTLIDES